MDEFDLLLDLTRAAESCNAVARGFIDSFSRLPDYSTIGGHIEPWAAGMQAKEHLRRADDSALHLEEMIRKWDEACSVLWYVGRAVGTSRLPLTIDGQSYQTAHEAARYLVEAVLQRYRFAEGFDAMELCASLAENLSDLSAVPDLYGWIQGEHHAAAELVPFDQDGEHVEPDEEAVRDRERKDQERRHAELISAIKSGITAAREPFEAGLLQVWKNTESPESRDDAPKAPRRTPVRESPKTRGAVSDDREFLWIKILLGWHHYDADDDTAKSLRTVKIELNEIVTKSKGRLNKSKCSRLFKTHFGSYKGYEVLCQDIVALHHKLRVLDRKPPPPPEAPTSGRTTCISCDDPIPKEMLGKSNFCGTCFLREVRGD